MDSGATTKPCHLVAMPYAGRGHINPMMNLCKILSSKVNNNPHHLRITFIVTEEWLGFIGSGTKPPTITFATIPNVLPSELVRAADMRGFFTATFTKMKDPFEQLLDRIIEEESKSGVNVILADSFLTWVVEVGNRRGIPVASFWPMSAIAFGILNNYHLIKRNGHHHPSKDRHRPEIKEEVVDYIPGISSIRVADLPSHLPGVLDEFILRIFPCVKKAQYLLFTSILELEPHVFRSIKQDFSFPTFSVGPLIPYFNIEDRTHDHEHYKWLDNQPPGSVLYVSMGSFLSFSDNELVEIAAGLDDSGVSYFWVARNDALKRKKKMASDSRGGGLIVPWCDQLQVLSHPSIGGFWTHCGWSSTVEAIFAGVPMLTTRIRMDQFPNSKMIVDDWKIGSRVVEEANGLLMSRGHIAKVVKEFMDSEREERKEMLRNIKDIHKICRGAVEGNGSSAANIDSFLSCIGVFPCNV